MPAEEAEIAPIIFVTVTKGGSIIVEDNGPGIPAETIQWFSITRSGFSSREAYCSPTRGQQGNALKTILPMAVRDGRQPARMPAAKPSSRRTASRTASPFEVDHIKQEPKITHTTKPSKVVKGTRITVALPRY